MISQMPLKAAPQRTSDCLPLLGRLLFALVATLTPLLALAQSPAIETRYLSASSGSAGQSSAGALTPLLPSLTPQSVDIRAIERLRRSGNLQAALERAQALVTQQSQNAEAAFVHALILADLGRTDEAIAAFSALANAHPELEQPLNNLAVLHVRTGALERAREALEGALRANPSSRVALENMADLYAQLALQTYQRLNDLDPAHRTARAKLIIARELVGQNAAPTRSATQALQRIEQAISASALDDCESPPRRTGENATSERLPERCEPSPRSQEDTVR